MTLGRWFREYVYIPLGGNRKGRLRTCFNLLVVWSLTALWHGATPNFLIWGAELLLLLGMEKLFLYKRLNKSKLIGHLYVILLVPVTWMAFSITNVKRLWIYYTRMFPFLGKTYGPIPRNDYVKYLGEYGGLFLIAILFATPIPLVFYNRMKRKAWTKELLNVILLLILGLCLYYMAVSTNNPFLYFNF